MKLICTVTVVLGCACSSLGALAATPPDFSGRGDIGWVTQSDFFPPREGPGPITDDPAHPHIRNDQGGQPNFRIGDLRNPILKPSAREQMRRSNEDVLAGQIAYTARSSCMPAGVPDFLLFPVEPIYFVQTAKEVLIIFSGDAQVRHVYMDVTHTKNLKPSWYGESVGHYEGDTLVVDTIGQNDKTFIDSFRTPHSEKLHVVERFRMTDSGKTLEVNIRIEDPETFTMPWSAVQRFTRVNYAMPEEACAENNQLLFDFHIPEDKTPDF